MTPVADPAPLSEAVEEQPQARRFAGVVRHARPRGTAWWTLLVLVALLIGFSIASGGDFSTPDNFRSIAINGSLLLILAVGMTLVIITGGIDLSVGAILVFASVVSAKVMETIGGDGTVPSLLGLVVAVGAGLAWGLVNGVLVAWARITPLIATLGTLGMATGAALLITDGVNVRRVPLSLVLGVGNGEVLGIPWLVLIAAAIAVVGGVMLARTRFGRYTYAIGSNTEASRRAGIAVDRHLIKVYALSGLLAGVAGFLSLARFATTSLAGHQSDNLQAIAAVVLGGTSLFGGIGTIAGTAAGVFVPVVLQSGFVVVGVQPFWQQVAVGAVLVAAVYADQLRRRRAQEAP